MYALFVKIRLEPGREDEARQFLNENVVPMVKQAPGLVAGYWWKSSEDGLGLALNVFETEEAARSAADMASAGRFPMPDYASMAGMEVVPLDAQA